MSVVVTVDAHDVEVRGQALDLTKKVTGREPLLTESVREGVGGGSERRP